MLGLGPGALGNGGGHGKGMAAVTDKGSSRKEDRDPALMLSEGHVSSLTV